MVAVVAESGLGLLNTSLNVLGESGVLGHSGFGQANGWAFVNAVTGNLVLQMEDEQLSGCGLDLFALRTYNSLETPDDRDEDVWRWSYEQTVRFEGPGTPAQPLPGATTIRTGGDGHETTHTWNAERSAYIGIDGDGAHDELRYDSAESEAESEWVWTDGSTRVTERYTNSTSSAVRGRMVRRTDRSGNSVVLSHDDGGRLNRVQDAASQQELRLTYGLVNGKNRVRRLESRTLIEDAGGRPTEMLGGAVRQVTYDYDSSSRLTTVTRYLTPDGGAGASAFVTSYAYVGATTRIGSLSQSDGTSVFFGYDSAGRVSTVNDHSAATNAQLSFSYRPATDSTEITDGNGQIWTYRFDRRSQQLTEVLTPLVSGGAGRPLETRKLDECDRCREWHQSPSLIPNFARDP